MFRTACIVLFVWTIVLCAMAQTSPTLMNYQGRLTKPNGSPLDDGAYTITLSIWDDLTSSEQVHKKWEEQVNVILKNGVFATLLGQNTPLTPAVFASGIVYMEIKIDNNPPMSPRQPIVSVPWAFRSETTNSVGDGLLVAKSGNIGIGTNNPSYKLTVGAPYPAVALVDGPVRSLFFTDMHRGFGYIGTETGHGFAIRTSNQDRIVILPEGSVGIGTTNPTAKLHVEGGEVRLPGATANNPQNWWTLFGAVDGRNHIAGDTYFGWNGGNVGIGPVHPQGRLHVVGGQVIFPGASEGNPNRWETFFAAPDGKNYLRGSTIIADTGGNVGIGTTSPTRKLEVADQGGVEIGLRSFQANRIYTLQTGSNGLFQIIDRTANSGRIRIATNGYVGIGVTPGSYRLELPNTASGEGRGFANQWVAGSSIRWKENIRPIESALDKVLRLEGVRFTWKADYGGTEDIGFIAEDVAKILPDIVNMEPGGQFASGLDYGRVVPVLVEAMKDMHRNNQLQQRRIEHLEKLVEELRSLISQSQR